MKQEAEGTGGRVEAVTERVEGWSWHAIGGWKGEGEYREQPLASASERTGVTRRKD